MKKLHHYYKTTDDGHVGVALQAFMGECAKAQEAARQWAERQGANRYYESFEGMAGGVSAVEFAQSEARDGWNRIVAPDGRVVFTPAEDSDLEKEMHALPVVSEAELITILSLVPRKTDIGLPLPFTFGNTTPILFRHHGFYYVDVPYESGDHSVMPIDEKEFYRRRMAATNEQ